MSKTKKIISIVLAAVLVMSMATVAMISASAATTVYFENSEGWSEVYCYTYVNLGSSEGLGVWPGTLANHVDGNVWSMEIPDDCTHVIFNGGNGGPQTNNLENPGTSMIAKLGEGTEVNDFGQPMTVYVWEAYGEDNTTAAPTTAAATTVAPTTAAATTAAATTAEPTEAVTTAAATTVEPTEAATTVATGDEPTTTAPATTAAATTVEPTEAPTTVPVTTTAGPQGIVVDDEEYNLEEGQEVTYVANLKTPKEIEDVQGYVSYDADKLEVVDCNTDNLGDGAIVNTEIDGKVFFNASVVNGLDFTVESSLIEITFKVKDASYSEITLTIEEMTEKGGDSYFTGGDQVNDNVIVDETLKVDTVDTTASTPVESSTAADTTAEETTVADTTVADKETTAASVDGTTDATSATEAPVVKPDAPTTGASVAVFVALAAVAMAAAAVVVLRKKVNA